MNQKPQRWLALLALLAMFGFSQAQMAYAQDTDGGGLPQELHQGDLTFVTGGVGLDESQALRQAAPHWPLAIRFTGSGSDYLAVIWCPDDESGQGWRHRAVRRPVDDHARRPTRQRRHEGTTNSTTRATSPISVASCPRWFAVDAP